MSDKIDAAVLEFTVKGEQAVSTFGRIEDAAEKMETAAKRSADRTADSIAGIGKGAAANASAMEAGSRRFIAALEQEAKRVSMTRAEYRRWQAESRGIARDVYEPLIAKIEQAEAAQRSLSRTTAQTAEKLGGAFGGAVASVGALQAVLGGFGIVSFARGFVQAADSVTVLNNQLKLATGSTASAASAYEALFGIAQRSRTSFTDLGSTFASIARATDGLGISQGRLLSVTEAIGNAMAISGGNAQGMQAALTQLGQGLASGTLRGDELNSVLEQTPRLARAIADGMGVTVGKLRELGQEGKITAETIINALESQAGVLAAEVQNSVITVGQAWTQLGNSVTKAAGEFDKASKTTGTIAGAMQSLSGTIDNVADRFGRAREAGHGFIGSLVAAQVMATAEALGHVDANAANVGKRLGEAEKELARLQERFAQRGGYYLAQEVQKAEELRDRLREAKQAQDDMRAERGTSQSAQFGQASAGIDAIATKGLEAQKKATEALAAARNQALGVNASWVKSINEMYAAFQAGHIAESEYVETVKALTAQTYKKTAAHKAAGDAFAVERDAAKEWAKALKEAADIQADAEGKTSGLSKAQQALVGYLTSPAYATNSEAMRQMAVEAYKAAISAEQLGESHKRTAALVAEANGHYSKFIADLQRGVDSVEAQIVAMTDQAKAAEIAATRNITLAEAIQLVTIARLREKQAALDIPDAGAYSAIEREIEARERLLGLIRSKAATDANAEAARQQGDLWSQIASDAGQALSNALMEGGKDAGDYLKGYFRSLFGRELAAMFTSAIGSFGQYIGLASSARGGGGTLGQFASASGGMPQGNTLNTLYGAYNVAAGYLGYGGATAGAAAGTLGYANAVGAVGGDAIGALYAANNGWAGVAAGNSLGAAAAGEGVAAGSGAAAGAGGAATAIPVIGWIVAAVLASLAAYKGGATHDMLSGSYSRYATPGGSIAGSHYKVFKALGMSEKWATVLSGEALVSRLLGHKASVSGYGVGSVQDGDFVQGTSAPLQFGANTLKGGADPFLQNLSSDIAAAVTLAASSFGGGLTNGLRVGAVTDRDRDNEVAALLGYFGADNRLIAGTQTGSGAFGAGGPGNDASKIAAGDLSKWIGEQMPVLIIQGLQQSDLEDRFDAYFDGIAASTLTSEQATQFLNTAGAVQQLADAFGPLGGAFAQFDTLSVKAVASTAEAAGGFDALISSADAYYQRYFTEAERTTIATGRVREVLAGLGLAMPDVAQGADAARKQWRALVDVQDLSTEAGRQAFTTLLGVAGAFDEVVTAADAAAEAAAEAAKKLGDVITESITRFGTPGERQGSTFGSIATDLQRDAGVSFSIGQLMGASLADIEAFARGFITVSTNSDAAKTAVLGAANALFDLKTKASDKSGSLQVELLKAQGHALEAVNLERKAEIAQLAALEASLGVAAGTFTDFQRAIYAANDAAAAVARQKSLLAGVDSVVGDFLSGSELSNYFGARIQQILAGGGIDASVATILGSTRGQVLELFQAVGIDGKEAILEALPLWEQMRKAIDGTSDTIASFVKDLQRFTGSLKFSDLSPLSAEAQLTAAQSLYETTLAKAQAGDQDARAAFTGVAQSYLQEAQGAYASGMAYTNIFNKVLGDSDALALALSGGTSAITTALTKGGSTGGTTATTSGTSTSATKTDSALQIQGASSVTAVYDSEVTKVLLEIDDWNRSIVQTFLLGEHGFIADLLRSIDAKMGGDPAGHADALASALSSAPTDRTFIEGPAGSSGGLSGPKRGQYIDIPQSLGTAANSDQAALLAETNAKLGEVVKRLDAIAKSNDANAAIGQQAIKANIERLEALRMPLERAADEQRSANSLARVMPRPRR